MFFCRQKEIKEQHDFPLYHIKATEVPKELQLLNAKTGFNVPTSLMHRSWTHLHGQQQQPPCEPHSWELPESRCCYQGCSVPQCSGSSMTLLLQSRTWSHPTHTLLPGASLKTNFIMNTILFPLRLQISQDQEQFSDGLCNFGLILKQLMLSAIQFCKNN